MKIRRTRYKDDWHCGHSHNCGCWKNPDVEKDKTFLAWCFRSDRLYAEVNYTEYKRDPDEGSESRDRNIYHVTCRADLVSDTMLNEAAWHGFALQWIAANGKNKLSLAFEHNGVYVEK